MGRLPLDRIDKYRRARLAWSPAPAHHQRLDQVLQLGSHVQEPGAFGRRQPLVAVAAIEVSFQPRQVDVDLPRRVRAVDDRPDASLPGSRNEPLDRQGYRRGRGDVAEKQDARAGRETGPHRFDHLVGVADWQWQRLDHQFGLAVLRHEGPRALERAVFVVGGQNLVAWLEWQ